MEVRSKKVEMTKTSIGVKMNMGHLMKIGSDSKFRRPV